MTLNKKFISTDYLFRGKEYKITCIDDGTKALGIEIEDKSTYQEWTGSFTSEYIEELTKKTGNFKSYEVFVSMLQTVLIENAGSLSLDLMTYNDLEELRKLKMGSLCKGSNNNADTIRQNKRYLILTYTTDFDKIHYPLPLAFQGISDIEKLKNIIKDLREQIYNSAKGNSDFERFEISDLNKRILKLQNENDHLVSTLEKYKTHLQSNDSTEDLKRELKAVRVIVRSLEEDLAEERSKHQRVLLRKNRESKSLTDEIEELKASKRNLNFKVHSLTNELAIYKRQRLRNGVMSPRPPICPSPKSSLDLLASSSKTLSRALRNSRSSPLMLSDPETNRINASRRAKSISLTNRFINTGRRCSSADRYGHGSRSNCKFDPTAYIEEQKMRKKEVEEKRKREIRSRIHNNNLSDRSRGSSPSSYRDSNTAKLIKPRFGYISSSNVSSTSDLDEKSSRGRSRNRHTLNNKHTFGVVTESNRRPTPLNDTDDAASENDSLKPHNNMSSVKKYSSGFKSDDSSTNGDNTQRRLRTKYTRSYILDSGDDEIGARASNFSKSNKKGVANKSSTVKTSRTQQSNNNHMSYNHPSSDINDIDQRLNALQDFFQKYLHNE